MTSDQAMRELADKATDGPWEAWTDQDGTPHMQGRLMVGNAAGVIPDGETFIDGVEINPIAECYTPEDRAFIAACREWVPEVLERLERVRALHQPESDPLDPTTMLCRHCSWDSDVKHPCPTIQALDEKGTHS